MAEKTKDSPVLAARVIRPGNRPVFGPVEPIKPAQFTQKTKLTLSIISRQIYVIREQFLNVKPDILSMQVDDRIKKLGVFSGSEGLVTQYKIIEKTPNSLLLSIIVLPSAELDEHLLSMHQFQPPRITKLCTQPASLAGLIGSLTDEPVLSMIIGDQELYILVSQRKIPFYTQLVPLESNSRQNLSMAFQNIELTRLNIKRLFGIEIKKVIALGPRRNLYPEIVEDATLWNPDWDKVLGTARDKDLLEHPCLFGGYFADKAFDLVPWSHRMAWVIQDAMVMMSGGLLGGAICLGLLTINTHSKAQRLDRVLDQKLAMVKAEVKRVEGIMPFGKEAEIANKLFELKSQTEQQPRIDEILKALSVSIPKGVYLLNMDVSREPATDPNPRPVQATALTEKSRKEDDPEHILNQKIVVSVKLVTNRGFSQTKRLFEDTLSALESFFVLKNVKWIYSEKANRGTLNLLLVPRNSQGAA